MAVPACCKMLNRASCVLSPATSTSAMRLLACCRLFLLVVSISCPKESLLDSAPFCARIVASEVSAAVIEAVAACAAPEVEIDVPADMELAMLGSLRNAALLIVVLVVESSFVYTVTCEAALPPPNSETPLNVPAPMAVSWPCRARNSVW